MKHARIPSVVALATLTLLVAGRTAGADDDDVTSLDGVKVALETAVGTAATAGKGTPVAAGVEREEGKVLIEVLVVRMGEPSLYEVEIDAATGQVVEVEREDVEEENEADEEEGDHDDEADEDDDEHTDLAAMVRALDWVVVPLADAIKTAAAHGKGKAVEAELERDKDGKPVWDVHVLAGGKVHDVLVDVATGTVLAMRAEDEDGDDDDEKGEEDEGALDLAAFIAWFRSVPLVTLAQAIATAEGAAKGRAVEAEYEMDDGKLVVEVTVFVPGPPTHLVEVEIDARTGAVIEVESADEHDKEDGDDEDDGDDK